MCQPSIEHQMVRSLISYCYTFFYFCSILNYLLLYMVSNLSLAAEVMCISASPGFWMMFPMILVQGLPMTLTVAWIDSPAM